VYNIQGEFYFQKLQNFWVAKALMSSYILCKILSFLPVLRKKYSIDLAHSHWQSLTYYELSIFRSDLFVAPSETELLMLTEASIVNKDCNTSNKDKYCIKRPTVFKDMFRHAYAISSLIK